MSQDPRIARPASSRARPSRPTSRADRAQSPGDHVVEAVAELAPEPVEAVVAEYLAPGALVGALTLAGTDEHDDLALGHAAEQSFDERCSEEARRSGHGDPPAGELVAYHGSVSSTRMPRALTIPAAQMAQETATSAAMTAIEKRRQLGGSACAGARFFGAGRRDGFGGV